MADDSVAGPSVPFEEVAAVLGEAALRLSGGPARSLPCCGSTLAAALYAAGFRVVRDGAGGDALLPL